MKKRVAPEPDVKELAAKKLRTATSFLKRQSELVVAVPGGPVPLKASPNRRSDLRGLSEEQVPIAAFATETRADGTRQASQRRRCPPLDTWRNERYAYERLPGSALPTVSAVILNCAPRPADAKRRELPLKVLRATAPLEYIASDAVGLGTEYLKTKVVCLPAHDPMKTKNPYTVTLDETELGSTSSSRGSLHVLEGPVRLQQQVDGKTSEAQLDAGDIVVLDCGRGPALVAATTGGSGARLLWILVASRPVTMLALQDANKRRA